MVSWASIPGLWSLNHQAEPCCSLPAVPGPWKQPIRATSAALSLELQGIEGWCGAAPRLIQPVQESSQCRQVHPRADAVVAGVQPQQVVHTVVVVPLGGRSEAATLSPAWRSPVPGGSAAPTLYCRTSSSVTVLPPGGLQPRYPVPRAGRGVPQVRREVTRVSTCEEVHPVIQGRPAGSPSVDVHPCGGGEPGQIVWKVLTFSVTTALSGRNAGSTLVSRPWSAASLWCHSGCPPDHPVVHKGSTWLRRISRTLQAPADDGAAVLPHLTGVGRRQVSPCNRGEAPQLQMAPVVQGLPTARTTGAGPSLKLLS